jgi:hypothetical protein
VVVVALMIHDRVVVAAVVEIDQVTYFSPVSLRDF